MNKRLTLRTLILLLLVITISCDNDDNPAPLGKYQKGVLISNEGNFSDVDGSVSYYDHQSEDISNKIFETENGRPLGGLLQSIGLHGENAYLIDNLGNKVEIVDANTFESVSTISEGFSIPRYFVADGNVGFISNWGPYADDFSSPDSYIAVINTGQNSLGQQIEVPSRPEGLIIADGKLFVSSQESSTITVINTSTLEITGSIDVGFGPAHFVVDKNDNLWVGCLSGYLYKIDAVSSRVQEEYQVGDLSGKLAIDGSGETIYLLTNIFSSDFSYTENEVLQLNISSPQTPTSIFSTQNLYGIGVDPETDIIYLANSNAFQGNGTIIRIDENGNEIDNFPAGRGPNGFVFRN